MQSSRNANHSTMAVTTTAILFLIVASVVNNLVVVAAENVTAEKSEPDETTTDGNPIETTTIKPVTTTIVAPTLRFSNDDDDEGFKPSVQFSDSMIRKNSNHRRTPLAKVKRQEEQPVVQLFNGAEPVRSPGANNNNDDNSDDEPRTPAKGTRGYYDESVHHRDYGPSNAYGNKFPQQVPRDEDNEIEHSPRPYHHPVFVQDPIISSNGRTSPDKYQHNSYGPGMHTSRPIMYNSPNSFNTGSSPSLRHPYSFDSRGSSYDSSFGGGLEYSSEFESPIRHYTSHHGSYHHSVPSTHHHSESLAGIVGDGIRETVSEIGLEIGPGVGRALKLLLPSALLLTGVSALFPNRVYVPTQPKPLNRQKRGVNYTPVNTDENIEYIPANLLRREHRTGDNEPELYDYDDGTPNSYFGAYVTSHKPKNIKQQVQTPKIKEEVQPQAQKPKNKQDSRPTNLSVENPQMQVDGMIPEFMPVPTSESSSQDDPIIPFELTLPENEYDAFQFRKMSQRQMKEELIHAKNANMRQNPLVLPSILPLNNDFERMIESTLATTLLTPATSTMAAALQLATTPPSTEISPTGASIKKVTPSSAAFLKDPRRIMGKRVRPRPGALLSPTTTVSTPSQQQQQQQEVKQLKSTAIPLTTSTLEPQSIVVDEPKRETMILSPSNRPPADDFLKLVSQQLPKEKKSINSQPNKQQELFKSEQKPSSSVSSVLDGATSGTPKFDLSPDGPVMGLLTAAVEHRQESDVCQRRALCELALRGTNPKATKFETFLWALANLTPNAFTAMYDIDDIFQAIRDKNCLKFNCPNPNLDIQE